MKQIVIDRKAETVILPIYGQPIPFHIATLKNVTKSDEQEYTLLRFNFITPGQVIGKKDNTGFENPNATFVRALSFKSSEVFRMNELCREINDLKKEMQKRDAERAEMADLVEQDSLIEIKGRRPLRLPEVYVRPALEGKRRPGDLEIHTNGLRYSSQFKGESKIGNPFVRRLHFKQHMLKKRDRHSLLKHQTSLFPALRRRAPSPPPRSLEEPHHDR